MTNAFPIPPYDAVIVDAMNLAWRAYSPLPDMRGADGRPHGLEHGFLTVLLGLVREQTPARLVLAWDGMGRVREDGTGYKGHRPPPTEERWVSRLTALRRLLALTFTTYYDEVTEADHQIARFVGMQERARQRTLIVSNDGDFHQLVSDLTHVGDGHRRCMDEAAVIAKWGVDPDQVTLLRAIKGDVSDNLPGVERIRTKPLAELVSTCGSIAALVEQMGSYPGFSPREREKLVDARDQILANYRMSDLSPERSQQPISYRVPDVEPVTAIRRFCDDLQLHAVRNMKEWRLVCPAWRIERNVAFEERLDDDFPCYNGAKDDAQTLRAHRPP